MRRGTTGIGKNRRLRYCGTIKIYICGKKITFQNVVSFLLQHVGARRGTGAIPKVPSQIRQKRASQILAKLFWCLKISFSFVQKKKAVQNEEPTELCAEVQRHLEAQARVFHPNRVEAARRFFKPIRSIGLDETVTLLDQDGKEEHVRMVAKLYICSERAVKEMLQNLTYYHDHMRSMKYDGPGRPKEVSLLNVAYGNRQKTKKV